MADKTRRLQFYLLSMTKKNEDKPISPTDLEAKFQSIVDDRMILIGETSRKAMQVDLSDGSYVIELIKQNEHISYLKLGIKNPANSVALRDRNTLETNSLNIGPTQNLEIYTFCVIDFETRILSYVGMNGSPRVSVLKDWLNKIFLPEGLTTTLAIIYSPDVLKALSKKKRVTSLKVDLAIPSDKELENIGVIEPTFDSMRGQLTRTLSYIIRAERGKSLFDEPGLLEKNIRKVLDGVDEDSIELFSAYGKDDGDTNPQVFNLLDYGVTVWEKISRSNYDYGDDEKRMNIIYTTYKSKKADILSFIRA